MLPRLAAMVLNQHHLITPAAAEAVLGALDGRIDVDIDFDKITEGNFGANAFVGTPVRKNDRLTGYRLTDAGAAIVQVRGELVNRGAWVGAYSGLTSYEGLRHTLRLAASDGAVRSIVLDVDSPGGMVAGAFETAQLIRDIAAVKPVVAVANDSMASAAYLLASGASRIVAGDGSGLGSIGVLYVHTDKSGELEKRGVRVTLIHAGKHKVDGHPFGALPEMVRLEIQARGNAIHTKFIDAVVAGRNGRLEPDDVRATEARVFTPEEAVERGLADQAGTFDSALADAEAGKIPIRKASRPTSRPAKPAAPQNDNATPAKEAARMSTEKEAAPAAMTAAQVEDLANKLTAALAEQNAPAKPAAAAPVADPTPPAPTPAAPAPAADGAATERARISAILGHAEAVDRPVAARVLALESDLGVDQAVAMLAKLPKDSAAGGKGKDFYAAVAASGGNPKVKADGGGTDGGAARPTMAQRMAKTLGVKAA